MFKMLKKTISLFLIFLLSSTYVSPLIPYDLIQAATALDLGWEQAQKVNGNDFNSDGFGNGANMVTRAVLEFGGYIYSIADNSSGSSVWRSPSSDGTTWSQVTIPDFNTGNINRAIYGPVIFNNKLYLSTENLSGTEVWTSEDGETWAPVNENGFGNIYNTQARALGNDGSYLYYGTRNANSGAEVWRTDGTNWFPVSNNGFGDVNNTQIIPGRYANGYVYGVTQNNTTGAEVWRYDTAQDTWAQINSDGFGSAATRQGTLEVLNGQIYVGTWNSTGGSVYKYSGTGTSWELISSPGLGDANNKFLRLKAINGVLYAGTQNSVSGAEVWKATGDSNWSQINTDGFGITANSETWLSLIGNYIYAGTHKMPTGGQILRLPVESQPNQPPTLFPIENQQVIETEMLQMTLQASDPDVNDTLTFSSPNLPQGATLLPTGEFSWTPSNGQAGIYPVTFTVDDGKGGINSKDILITVIDSKGWQRVNEDGFGDSANNQTTPLIVFNGYVYAKAINFNSGATVWRSPSSDGTNWTQVTSPGFDDPNNTFITRGSALNGILYFATYNPVTGAEIWRSSTGDIGTWTQANSDGFGNPENIRARPLGVANGYLYFGTDNNNGGEVWRTDGDIWEQVNINGFGDINNKTIQPGVTYEGYVYAVANNSVTGVEVWRFNPQSYDPQNPQAAWEQINTDGFGEANTSGVPSIFNGNLYVGTGNSNGGNVYRYSGFGTDWVKVAENGFGDVNNRFVRLSPQVVTGSLYAGTVNGVNGSEVWSTTDGTNWTQINTDGFGNIGNKEVFPWLIDNVNGYLYTGTFNTTTGGEIWRLPVESQPNQPPTNPKQLTTPPPGSKDPDISPDGNKIVYLSGENYDSKDIWLMNADGSAKTNITNNPSWYSDPNFVAGGRIAFVREIGSSMDIYTMNTDGSGIVNITNTEGINEGYLIISGDGSKIAFPTFYGEGQQGIGIINADGSNPFYFPTSGIPNSMSLNMDGSKLIYDDGGDIWMINYDGTGQTNLTNSPDVKELAPNFSPDGSKIAYHTDNDGYPLFDYELKLMNSDGTGQITIASGQSSKNFGQPQALCCMYFSPDGSQLIYNVSGSSGTFDMYKANTDGSGTQILFSGQGGICCLKSSDDGSKIVYSPITNWQDPSSVWLYEVGSGINPPPQSNRPPVAEASGPYTFKIDGQANFDASGSSDPDVGDGITKYEWDLNNDGVYEAQRKVWTLPDPDSGGVPEWRWDLNNDGIYEKSTGDSLFPVDSFFDVFTELNAEGNISYKVKYTSNRIDASFFDVFFETEISPPGSESVNIASLRVTDNSGLSSTAQTRYQVTYDNRLPTADAGGPYEITDGDSLTLNGSASDPDENLGDSVSSISWDLNNDGDFNDATGTNPTITDAEMDSYGLAARPEPYTIALKVTDTNNGITTAMASVAINRRLPDYTLDPYTVRVTTTPLPGTDRWRFTYEVTNNNQQYGFDPSRTGLAALWIQIPNSANILNVSNPNPYWGWGYWGNYMTTVPALEAPDATLLPGNSWLLWWGYWPGSTYPMNSTATFSFDIEGVKVGSNNAALTTWSDDVPPQVYNYYYNGYSYYVGFTKSLISPIPANQPPVLQPIGDQIVSENNLLSFNLSAGDPNGDTLTYSVSNAPAGLSVDPSTGAVSWTPDYSQSGTYDVSFTVSDGTLNESKVAHITVYNTNRPPVVDAGPLVNINEGSSALLSGTANDPDGDSLTNIIWEFGDGSSASGSSESSHVYTDNGLYTAKLKVFDGTDWSEDSTIITVNNVAPTVEASADKTTVQWGDNVQFTGSFSDPGVNDTHTYSWDFGDGTSSTELNPIHSYARPGTYTARLRVTDNTGAYSERDVLFTVKKRDTQLIISANNHQYSDKLTIAGRLSGSSLVGPKNIVITYLGMQYPVTTGIDGSFSLTIQDLSPAGPNQTEASFAGDDFYNTSTASIPVNVSKEQATISYTGDTLKTYGSEVTLTAEILEKDTDSLDQSLGQIENATPVEFVISNESGTYQIVRTGNVVEISSGRERVLTTVTDLPIDVYNVTVRLGENGYYEALEDTTVLVVYNPSSGVAGAGWILNENGKKTNFGFNAKYKDENTLQGEFTMIDRSTGSPMQIKSTQLDWLVIRDDNTGSLTGVAQFGDQGSYNFRTDFIVGLYDEESQPIFPKPFEFTSPVKSIRAGGYGGLIFNYQINVRTTHF